ncbi:DEKNAAC101468 [Brettanomyces naardenensis]|uniref:DEKNAAC101468 n=1 Tax=Brettanomyces naardenensis TaxID=13370 RepID=A0A448YID1_BRENA|nr:DEKNAAC101468 [Brettanomyces naardenensis]
MFLFSFFSKEKKTSKASLKRRKQRTTKHRLSHPFHKKVFHLEYWMDRATGFATAPDLLGMASPLTPDNLSIIDSSQSNQDVAMVESPKDSQPSSKLFSENVAPTPETRPSPVMSDSANLPDGKSEEARRLIQDLLTLPASQLPSLFPLPGLKPPTKDTEWESLLSIDATESRSILVPNDENEPVNVAIGAKQIDQDRPVHVPIGAKQIDQDKPVSAAKGANKPASVPTDENKQVNVPIDNESTSVDVPDDQNKPVSAVNGGNKPASVPIDENKQVNVPIDNKPTSIDVPNDQNKQVSASIDTKSISAYVPIDQNKQVIIEETNPPPVAKRIPVIVQAKDIKPPSVHIPDVAVPKSKPTHKRKRKTPKDPRQFMLDAIAASREYDKKHYENKVGHRTKPVVNMPGLSQACAKELQGLLGGHVEVAVPKEVQKVERAKEDKKIEQAHEDKKNEQVPEVKKHTPEANMIEPTPRAKKVEQVLEVKRIKQAPVAKKVEPTPDVDPPKINSPLKDISSIDADKLPSDIPPPTPPYSLPDTPTESESVREYNRSFGLTDRLNLDRFRKLRPFIRRPAFATRQYRTKSDTSKLLIIDDILVGVRSSNLKTVTIIPNGPLYADPSLPPLPYIRPISSIESTDDNPVDGYNCEPKEKPVKTSAKNLIKERGNSKTKASKVDRSTHLKNISGNDNCHEYHDRRDPSGQRLRTLALLKNANKSCGDFSMGFEGNDKVYSKTCQKVRFADTVECHEIDQEAVVRPLREGEDPWLVYGEERRKRRRFEYEFKPISALKVKLSPFWKTDIKLLAYTKNVTFKQFEKDVKRRIKEFKKGRWKADRMVQLHLYERSNEHVRWEE